MEKCELMDLDEAFKETCSKGYLNIVEYLLEQDNKFNSIRIGKITALKTAVRTENLLLLKLLIKSIKTQLTPIYLDALHLAMETSKKECVKYLLVDLNVEVNDYWHSSFSNSTSYKKEMKEYYKQLITTISLNKKLINNLENNKVLKSFKL